MRIYKIGNIPGLQITSLASKGGEARVAYAIDHVERYNRCIESLESFSNPSLQTDLICTPLQAATSALEIAIRLLEELDSDLAELVGPPVKGEHGWERSIDDARTNVAEALWAMKKKIQSVLRVPATFSGVASRADSDQKYTAALGTTSD